METKQILENNGLIADFMGIKYVYDDKYISEIKEMRKNGVMFEQGYMQSELKYHSSWDWLMEVVRKIHETKDGAITIESNASKVSFNGQTKVFAGGFKDQLSNTYLCVVEFIKWLNKNQKS